MSPTDTFQLARDIRELAGPAPEPAPPAPLQVAVVATPPPRSWLLIPTRDEASGLIVAVHLEPCDAD